MPALVQMTAWYRPADKPLSEPMMVSLLTYIYVTWTTNIHFKDKQHLQENFKGQAMDYPLWVFLEKIDYVWTAVHCTNSDIDWNFHCQHCHPNLRTSLQLFFSLQIKLEGKVIPFFSCKIVTKDQSHNALNTYPTMHHFVTEMCTFLIHLIQNGALWDIGTDALWDLCYRSLWVHVLIPQLLHHGRNFKVIAFVNFGGSQKKCT